MGSKLCLPVYVKPLKGIQHSTLACNVYYVHYIIHRTKGMTFFYDVLDKLRLIVYLFIVSVMLSESHVERTTSLSNILFFGTSGTSIDILSSCQICLVFGFPAFPRVFSSYYWLYMPLSNMCFLNGL